MCGICGKWDKQGVSRPILERMSSQIRHRGPDDEGYYVNGPIGLANRRLSIIDLDTGNQPISNEDESLWIVFNGEIYNYPALRDQLVSRGHSFKTKSDTEVIIHLYEDYGIDCVKHLRGMFAFALWDEKMQRLFLARDPLGQKPLYYALRQGRFSFASEIKALLQESDITPNLNSRAMHDYISLRCIPGADTLFEGIHKLPASHRLTMVNGELTIDQYWDLQYSPKHSGSEEELTAQLKKLLSDTISCHLLSDVPVGAFLSGGLDSSLIVAMMSAHSDKPIKTFSIGVREHDFNELPYAQMLADRYRTDHHAYYVEPNLLTTLPEMIWHMEEPVDPFAFGVFTVSKLASQHVKVVLGGDGGDEMFAGYDRYLGNKLVDRYCLLPSSLRNHIIEPLIDRLPDNYSYNNRVQKLKWLTAMSTSSAGERYALSASFLRFSHAQKQKVYTRSLWRELGGMDSSGQLISFFEADNAENAVDKMLYTDVRTRLAEHLLMTGDRMTMAHSIEGRSPYVDQIVAEFVATLPANLKLNGRRLRHIQRQVARDYLPEQLIERPKKGFGFPLAYWFKNELRGLMTKTIQDSSMVAAGFFKSEAMSDLLSEHVNGEVDHNYRLWLLLNLELWYRLFIDGISQDDIRNSLQQDLIDEKIMV